MAVAIQIITEVDILAQAAIDGFAREVIGGQWAQEGKMAGYRHAVISGNITFALMTYCKQTNIGKAFGDGLHFVIEGSPNCVTEARIPDAAFVGNAKLALVENPQGLMYFAPDIAVEVVSPTESARSIREKMVCYMDAGTQEFWVVYPEKKLVVVHLPDVTAFDYGAGDMLRSSVLPNLPVASIFEF